MLTGLGCGDTCAASSVLVGCVTRMCCFLVQGRVFNSLSGVLSIKVQCQGVTMVACGPLGWKLKDPVCMARQACLDCHSRCY